MTQQPPEATRLQENQVQSMEADYEAKSVVEEEVFTKGVENKACASTTKNTSHHFKTSRENYMIL